MLSEVSIQAPAKINLTLEVLGRRDDGYHEIRSVMQTISTTDLLAFDGSDELTLRVYARASFRRRPQEQNLVYRAAALLQRHAGIGTGAQITLSKQIPIAAGLGGGSSDAAATLRGLRALWQIDVSDDELCALGAELGSDVPFFIRGGTALVSGLGERIEPLPDPPKRRIALAWPRPDAREDKTRRMYGALRPQHYRDGSRSERLAERLRRGEQVRDEDTHNVFEAVLPEIDRPAGETLAHSGRLGLGSPHLCGSGPAHYFLDSPLNEPGVAERATTDGIRSTQTMSADECAIIRRGR